MCLLAIIVLLPALYFACKEIAERVNELADIRDSKPAIGLARCENTSLYLTPLYIPMDPGADTSYLGPFQLLQLWYVNNARHPETSATAKSVSAKLVFKRRGTDMVTQEAIGAWTFAGAPTDAATGDVREAIDIPPNDIPARLNVAIKWPQDQDAYVRVYECFRENPDGRRPGMELPPGEYDLSVSLRGLGVQTEDSFVFSHQPKGTPMVVLRTK
jgi:hypothetical protein